MREVVDAKGLIDGRQIGRKEAHGGGLSVQSKLDRGSINVVVVCPILLYISFDHE